TAGTACLRVRGGDMRVYVGEEAAEVFRLWLVEQRREVSADEVVGVLRELDQQGALSGLRGEEVDEAARRAALEHKNDVLAAIRAAHEAPPPRLLLEHHERFSGEAVARAVLAAELGVPPTDAVVRQCARDLVPHGATDDLRILGSEVHRWLLA